MCDFKPGDEVVCVDATGEAQELVEGQIYVVTRVVGPGEKFPTVKGLVVNAASISIWVRGGFDFYGQTGRAWPGYYPHRFRKAQRRDLSTWLKTSVGNTDKLDKRQKKGVRA